MGRNNLVSFFDRRKIDARHIPLEILTRARRIVLSLDMPVHLAELPLQALNTLLFLSQ